MVKYREQSREDVSWHILAGGDRCLLICEENSIGAGGDAAGRREGEKKEEGELSHFLYPFRAPPRADHMPNVWICPFNYYQSPLYSELPVHLISSSSNCSFPKKLLVYWEHMCLFNKSGTFRKVCWIFCGFTTSFMTYIF